MPYSPAEKLSLGYFSASVVSRIAQAGPYADHGVAVTEDPVPSSTEQFRRVADGTYDLVLTSPDNVLNYRVNPSNPLGRLVDVRILAGVDRGMGLSLLGAPGSTSIAELRGRRIGVDVPTSGFAGALFDILRAAGLGPGDYEVLSLGSTPRRVGALLGGGCDATMLNAGHDVIAEHRGATRLARVSTALGRYPGSVLAAHADVVEKRPDALRSFLRAWREAVDIAVDPHHHELVESELARGLDIDHDVARDVYRTLLDPDQGLIADCAFDAESWSLLVDLRERADRFDDGVNPALVRHELPVTELMNVSEKSPVDERRC